MVDTRALAKELTALMHSIDIFYCQAHVFSSLVLLRQVSNLATSIANNTNGLEDTERQNLLEELKAVSAAW